MKISCLLLLVWNVAALARVVHVKDGVLVDGGRRVGSTTSELQKNVLGNSTLFPQVSSADWEGTSMVNASLLRYLVLEGDYLADVPLRLPSLFNGS